MGSDNSPASTNEKLVKIKAKDTFEEEISLLGFLGWISASQMVKSKVPSRGTGRIYRFIIDPYSVLFGSTLFLIRSARQVHLSPPTPVTLLNSLDRVDKYRNSLSTGFLGKKISLRSNQLCCSPRASK